MLLTRVLTVLVLLPPLVAIVVFLPEPYWAGFLLVVFTASAWEWTRVAGFSARTQALFVVTAFAVMVGVYALSRWGGVNIIPYIVWFAALWWWAILIRLKYYVNAVQRGENHFSPTWARFMAGLLVLVPAAFSAYVIREATTTFNVGEGYNGVLLLVLSLFVIWGGDMGGYFGGRFFGHVILPGRKLAPAISPNKTLAGVVGGITFAVIMGGALLAILGVSLRLLPWVFVVCGLVYIISIVGDLYVSMHKRQVGLKDTSQLLPGHGGLLDRIDSVVAGLPVFAAGMSLLGQGLW